MDQHYVSVVSVRKFSKDTLTTLLEQNFIFTESMRFPRQMDLDQGLYFQLIMTDSTGLLVSSKIFLQSLRLHCGLDVNIDNYEIFFTWVNWPNWHYLVKGKVKSIKAS